MSNYYSPVSLPSLSESLREGTLSLNGYIEQVLSRMAEVEPVVHSFVPEEKRRERLNAEAEALEKRYPDPYDRPPLYGILVGVKDVINVKDLPTRAGSQLPPNVFDGAEGAVVFSLKKAGALILGKTECTEFAYFQPGPTTNPINPGHTPGGSSSGSAAAVAAGISPLTIGTQTIASIIRPAAYCGVVGFKPSLGRVSTYGVFPFSQSADQVGFFTADLKSMETVASIGISNYIKSTKKSKPRCAVPSCEYLDQADPTALQSFRATVCRLKEAGYEIVTSQLYRNIDLLNKLHMDLISAEFSQNHQEYFWEYSELYSPHAASLYKQGLRVSIETLKRAREQQIILRCEITEKMEQHRIELWLTPAATRSAPSGLHSTGNPLMSLPWTFAGLPTLTIPAGKERNGLPFGLQVVAPYGQDEILLAYASEIDSVINNG